MKIIDKKELERLESIRKSEIDPTGKTPKELAQALDDKIIADVIHALTSDEKISYPT